MPSRPEILFPLFGQLTQFTGIGPKIAINLSKLNINSPRDLLFTLPHSLLIRNKIETVLDAINNDIIIIEIIVEIQSSSLFDRFCDFFKQDLARLGVYQKMSIIPRQSFGFVLF